MSNEILKFCETDTGTNLLTEAAYLADAQRLIGNAPGIARLQLVNKALRQSSFISKVFADYLVQQTGGSVLDNSNDASLLGIITSCFATGLPIGSVVNMLTSVVPTGFLKANGAAVSRTTYAALFNMLVTAPGYTLQTFTVSITSPAIVTYAGHGFVGGERLRLFTTGFLPTGLDTSTDYYVAYIDANTFNLQTISNVLAGTFVNTSGVQGGVQSYRRSLWGLGDGATTFNVPDLRGAFSRSWDDARGIDPSRAIATLQMDAFKNHSHDTSTELLNATAGSARRYRLQGISPSPDPTTSVGGTETRPINYALMPVIKY
jgi:microcystin-dependent protein